MISGDIRGRSTVSFLFQQISDVAQRFNSTLPHHLFVDD